MAKTLTYTWPVTGTTAPTAAQMAAFNTIVATLNWSDTEVSQAITHNWNLSATELASLFPIVQAILKSDSTTTVAPVVTVAYTDSSTVTLGKGTVVGTQGTLVVTLIRPHTITK